MRRNWVLWRFWNDKRWRVYSWKGKRFNLGLIGNDESCERRIINEWLSVVKTMWRERKKLTIGISHESTQGLERENKFRMYQLTCGWSRYIHNREYKRNSHLSLCIDSIIYGAATYRTRKFRKLRLKLCISSFATWAATH